MERHIIVQGLDLEQYHSLADVLGYPLNFCEDFPDPLVKLVRMAPHHEKVEGVLSGEIKYGLVLIAGEKALLEHKTQCERMLRRLEYALKDHTYEIVEMPTDITTVLEGLREHYEGGIGKLGLKMGPHNALARAKIDTIGKLAEYIEEEGVDDLKVIRKIGKVYKDEIVQALYNFYSSTILGTK